MPSDFDNSGDFRGGQLNQDSHIQNQSNYFGALPSYLEQSHVDEAWARFDRIPLDTVPLPASTAGSSNIPFAPNPTFVGRDDELRQLATVLKGGGAATVCQSAAATGLGGIGKTQLASEFCHRYGQYFLGGVFWLNLAPDSDVAAEVSGCSLQLGYGDLTAPEQMQRVLGHWQSEVPCLIVFDNCEEESLFQTWRPKTGASRIIVTSRSPIWGAASGVQTIPLEVLTLEASIELLLKLRPDLTGHVGVLSKIAEELGHLPLALHLAGSYLEQNKFDKEGDPESYLARLQEPGILSGLSLPEGEFNPTGHDQSVARTFKIGVDQLSTEEPAEAAARTLLYRAACFAPGEAIPRDLLKATVEENANAALRRLVDLGLVTEATDTTGAITVHRLAHMFILSLIEDLAQHQDVVEQVASSGAREVNYSGLPAGLTVWRQHLEYVADQADQRDSTYAATLLNSLGSHLETIADLDGAQARTERALEILETNSDDDVVGLATCLNNLGNIYKRRGELDTAQQLLERAIQTAEDAYGHDHSIVKSAVSNLGSVLRARGDLGEAQALYERVLQMNEKVYGPGHPTVAVDANNLASVIHDRGDLEGARPLFERAIEIGEATLGSDHPYVAIRLCNLASVLKELGELDKAQQMFERALSIDEEVYGANHPAVATDVNNLGNVFHERGDLVQAKQLYERALSIDERVFGPNHPTVAVRLSNLGSVLHDQGDLVGAQESLQKSIEIVESLYGPDHPSLINRLNKLGNTLLDQGYPDDAAPLFRRANELSEKLDDPDT